MNIVSASEHTYAVLEDVNAEKMRSKNPDSGSFVPDNHLLSGATATVDSVVLGKEHRRRRLSRRISK